MSPVEDLPGIKFFPGLVPDELRRPMQQAVYAGITHSDLEVCGLFVQHGVSAGVLEAASLLGTTPATISWLSLPNRAKDPEREFEFWTDDMLEALMGWSPPYNVLGLFHSHRSGARVGPSEQDIQHYPLWLDMPHKAWVFTLGQNKLVQYDASGALAWGT